MIERRRLLFAAVGLLAVPSPAIVRAASLMPVSVVRPELWEMSIIVRWHSGPAKYTTLDPSWYERRHELFAIMREWTHAHTALVLETDISWCQVPSRRPALPQSRFVWQYVGAA